MAQIDRITEALQRANESRQSDGTDSGSQLVLHSSVVPASSRPPIPQVAPGGLRTAITYSKTRIARVPLRELAHRRVVVDGASRELTNSIKLIRTQIVHRMRAQGWKTLAIVSAGDDEGKTFMAVNFAVSIAMEFDQTVLLVDADLRHPSVHSYFGLPGTPGLSNYLLQHTPLDHILVNPGIDRLVILPGGTPQPNSAELLGSPPMAALVADLKSRYADRLVLFDLPPILRVADTLSLAPLVDAFVLVVEDAKTRRDDIQQVKQILGTANVIGVVLNKSREHVVSSADAEPGWLDRLFGRR